MLGLGAILGRLLASSGGATALGSALVESCGEKGLPWALLGLGILVGMPVFFEVGLVLMMPIIAAAARRSHRPPILVGLPMLAGLSIVHGTIPPHPAAMLAATQYHADLGRTIVWGVMVGIPAGIMAGPVLEWVLTRFFWKKRIAAYADSEEPTLFEVSDPSVTQPIAPQTSPAPSFPLSSAERVGERDAPTRRASTQTSRSHPRSMRYPAADRAHLSRQLGRLARGSRRAPSTAFSASSAAPTSRS